MDTLEDFTQNDPMPIRIAPGGYYDLTIVFRPYQEEFAVDSLAIESNDPEEPVAYLYVAGQGLNYNFIMNASDGSEPHWRAPGGDQVLYQETPAGWINSVASPYPFPIPGGNRYSRVYTGTTQIPYAIYQFVIPDTLGGDYILEYSGPAGSSNAATSAQIDVVTPFFADTQRVTGFNERQVTTALVWAQIGGPGFTFKLNPGGPTKVIFSNPGQASGNFLRTDLLRVRKVPTHPQITVASREINFGTVSVNPEEREYQNNYKQTITIGSNGERSLWIYDIHLEGSTYFKIINLPKLPLELPAVNGRFDLVIEFTPQIPGFYSATLSIVSNSKFDSLLQIQLYGYGAPLPEFSIKLIASLNSYSDTCIIGMKHSATDSLDSFDLPKPPAPPSEFLYIYLPHPEWNSPFGPNFTTDFKSIRILDDSSKIWVFEVNTDFQNREIEINIAPDSLYPGYQIVLFDLTGNKSSIFDKNGGTYIFNSGTGGVRRFAIEIGGFNNQIQSGWNLVSVPLNVGSTSIISLLASPVKFFAYSYSPAGGYVQIDTVPYLSGFWLGVNSHVILQAFGNVFSFPVLKHLNYGWNILGVPGLKKIDKSTLLISYLNETLNIDSAISRNWIQGIFYYYDKSTKTYSLVDTLEPWKGYWFICLKDSLKLIYQQTWTLFNLKPEYKLTRISNSAIKDWKAKIKIIGKNSQNNETLILGFNAQATDGFDARFDILKPPSPPQATLSVYFSHPEWNLTLGDKFLSDIRKPFEDENLYEAIIHSTIDDEVKIEWEFDSSSAFSIQILDQSKETLFELNENQNIIFNIKGGEFRKIIFKVKKNFTNVEDNLSIPKQYALYQNYPNPFNPTTTIEFDIPEKTLVKLAIYDILGREVGKLIDNELEPGKYKISFNASNLPSGVYFYILKTSSFTQTRKMILIK